MLERKREEAVKEDTIEKRDKHRKGLCPCGEYEKSGVLQYGERQYLYAICVAGKV